MGFDRFHRLRSVTPLLVALGIEALVLLIYMLLPVPARNDVVPPNADFLQWTHLPSWYIVEGIAQLAPTFFDANMPVALLLLFGLQATLYALIVYGLTRYCRKNHVDPTNLSGAGRRFIGRA
jgi:hypothetical protein